MIDLWGQLKQIRHVSVSAQSARPNGYHGHGIGIVDCYMASPNITIFNESGKWHQPRYNQLARVTSFRNIFKWVQIENERIELSHLRYGETNPVFLFSLIPCALNQWVCEAPHYCNKDQYHGALAIDDQTIRLNWRITGPSKDETLNYCYTQYPLSVTP